MDIFEIRINENSKKGKYILQFLKDNKVKVKDPTKMTKKEFYAKLEEATAQYDRGEYTRLKSAEDIDKFLKEL